MTGNVFQLAQANIALGKGLMTEPVMQGFVDQLEYINSVADRSPGFVWRLQSEEGDATSIRVFDNPLIIFNMSVWESIDALYEYVYRSDHLAPLKTRREWFDRLDRPHMVLWWLPAGTVPDVAEGERRLNLIRDKGPHPAAFSFKSMFDAQGCTISRKSGHDWEFSGE